MNNRILIVDDDASFAYVLQKDLERAGYAVATAGGSIAALDMIDGGASFDLLIIDVRLAAGEPHGYAFGRMASLKLPKAPAVYVTAYEVDEETQRAAPGTVLQKLGENSGIISQVRQLLAA